MTEHDPRQVIEDLRNHMAAHDRPLSFLFGAGTSSAINVAPPPASGEKQKHQPLIPGIAQLTSLCQSAVKQLGDEYESAWTKLITQCETDFGAPNVGNVLSKLRMKIDAIGNDEHLLELDRDGLQAIETEICQEIAKQANPQKSLLPTETPHNHFATWVKDIRRSRPLEIFTTNYDILIESAIESKRVPVFDGFVGSSRPFFYPECLEDEGLLPQANWVRVWKLHGSINWSVEEDLGSRRIVRLGPTESGEMILPSHRKYDESRKQPYRAYMDRLATVMNRDHSLLISCGYSYGDEHINAILLGALDNRSTANVISLQFDELDPHDPLVNLAQQRPNLTVIGPNAAVISGSWGEWKLSQPVDNKTHGFMDIAFDSNAVPSDEEAGDIASTQLRGRMRLGDFNRFCKFLRAMGSSL